MFILPIAIIGLNYLILSQSKHPFLIHLVRPENRLMCLNIAFMSGLLFTAVPSIYTFAYIGIALAHLQLRFLKGVSEEWKEYVRGKLKIINRK